MLVNKQNDFFTQLFVNSVNATEIKNIINLKKLFFFLKLITLWFVILN